jgi:hypothetical protein
MCSSNVFHLLLVLRLMDQVSWMAVPALDPYAFLASREYSGNDEPTRSASLAINYQLYFYAWLVLPVLIYLIKRLAYKLTDRFRQSGFIPRRSKISGWIFLLSKSSACLHMHDLHS